MCYCRIIQYKVFVRFGSEITFDDLIKKGDDGEIPKYVSKSKLTQYREEVFCLISSRIRESLRKLQHDTLQMIKPGPA